MIPQAGSAYAYSYATLGELVAWIIGWDLILEYAVGNVAVAISWGDYFNTLLTGFGIVMPAWLTTGYRTALLSSDPAVHGLLQIGAAHRRHSDRHPHAGVRDRDADHGAAAAGREGERPRQQHHGGDQAAARSALFIAVGATHLHPANYHPFAPNGFTRHPPGRGDRLLRLHRLRRDLDRGRGDEEPAAQPADRHPRRPGDLHADLRRRRLRADRDGAVPASSRSRIRWRARCSSPGSTRSAGSSRSARRSRCRRCCWCSSTASRASSSRWRATACCRSGRRSSRRGRKIPFVTTLFTGIVVAAWSLIGDAGETYDLTNIGTLFAFILVCIGVLVLRYTEPERPRPFRVPFVWPVCAAVGAPAASSS